MVCARSVGAYTRHQLLFAVADLWIAGFETTVTFLRNALLALVNHPEVTRLLLRVEVRALVQALRKMQAEIDGVIGDRSITMDDQKRLPYCCAVIQVIFFAFR